MSLPRAAEATPIAKETAGTFLSVVFSDVAAQGGCYKGALPDGHACHPALRQFAAHPAGESRRGGGPQSARQRRVSYGCIYRFLLLCVWTFFSLSCFSPVSLGLIKNPAV